MSQETIIVLGHKHFFQVGGIGVSVVGFEKNIKNWKAIRAKWPTWSMQYRYITRRIAKVNQMLHEFERKYPT